MADFEGEEQDGEASPGRDRALTSPASPTRDGDGQTHGAGVGAARQGSRNATETLRKMYDKTITVQWFIHAKPKHTC